MPTSHDATATAQPPTDRAAALHDLQADDLQLMPVTYHGWRLVDTRLPPDDPFRLLAFIEHRDDGYEVMQMGSGFEWHAFGSLAEALEFVITTAPRMARERRNGDLIWIR